MLTLILPPEFTLQLEHALRRAGKREIGGILMGEHVGVNEFVVRQITIHRRGTFASFFRRIEDAWAEINRFFDRTKRDYRRFNYLGEWHSHPSFEPVPSRTDHQSMRDIVMDDSVGAHFAILMIVKLNTRNTITGTAHTYLLNGSINVAKLRLQKTGKSADECETLNLLV